MKTRELKGAALDWAVALANGLEFDESNEPIWFGDDDEPYYEAVRIPYRPSINWAQGGPIIEREELYVQPTGDAAKWKAYLRLTDVVRFSKEHYGPTPLIAAMRCYVASKFGDEIEIPKELV